MFTRFITHSSSARNALTSRSLCTNRSITTIVSPARQIRNYSDDDRYPSNTHPVTSIQIRSISGTDICVEMVNLAVESLFQSSDDDARKTPNTKTNKKVTTIPPTQATITPQFTSDHYTDATLEPTPSEPRSTPNPCTTAETADKNTVFRGHTQPFTPDYYLNDETEKSANDKTLLINPPMSAMARAIIMHFLKEYQPRVRDIVYNEKTFDDFVNIYAKDTARTIQSRGTAEGMYYHSLCMRFPCMLDAFQRRICNHIHDGVYYLDDYGRQVDPKERSKTDTLCFVFDNGQLTNFEMRLYDGAHGVSRPLLHCWRIPNTGELSMLIWKDSKLYATADFDANTNLKNVNIGCDYRSNTPFSDETSREYRFNNGIASVRVGFKTQLEQIAYDLDLVAGKWHNHK